MLASSWSFTALSVNSSLPGDSSSSMRSSSEVAFSPSRSARLSSAGRNSMYPMKSSVMMPMSATAGLPLWIGLLPRLFIIHLF